MPQCRREVKARPPLRRCCNRSTMAGKWLELLKEIAPRVTRVAMLFNPATAPGCGKLATKPLPIGSATIAKTMGMVRVCWAP